MKKLLLVLAIIFLIPSMSYSVEQVKINAFFMFMIYRWTQLTNQFSNLKI